MTKVEPTYWRSLEELERTPEFEEFLSKEFPHAAAEAPTSASRRRFMQLMGASVALAGATGCRWEQEKLAPFTRKPLDNMIPGVPKYYATAMDIGGVAQPLLATSYDGRPIKVDGNKQHPESLGGSSVYAQGTILEMYDPDRQSRITFRSGNQETVATWTQFVERAGDVFRKFRQTGGKGLRILSEASSSPTLARLKSSFADNYPMAKWIEFEPFARDNEIEGSKLAFGKAFRTQVQLAEADVILALDCDFLTEHPAALRLTREFTKRRVPGEKGMNRLYAAETRFTPTGAKADHRLPLRAEQIKPFLLAVEAAVSHGEPGFKTAGTFLGEVEHVKKYVEAVAADLAAKKGASAVIVGRSQPPEVHAIAHRLNAALGNVGKTIVYTDEPAGAAGPEGVRALAAEMQKGEVSGLVVLGGNPVYNTPADVKFAEALGKVATSIHLSLFKDETAKLCNWRLPKAHYLESWSDARAFDGSVTLVQPLIEPIYRDARSPIDLVLLMLGRPAGLESCLAEVRTTHGFPLPAKGAAADEVKEAKWREIVADGTLPGTKFEPKSATLAQLPEAALKVEARALRADLEPTEVEVVFAPDGKVFDGRFANNSWLQELPDSMTKMTWDNGAYIEPNYAIKHGIVNYARIKVALKNPHREVDVPVYWQFGHAPGSVTLVMGYGRTSAGQVGGSTDSSVAAVGVDCYPAQKSASPGFEGGASIKATGEKYEFACTQDHHAIDALGMAERESRMPELIVEATAEEASKPGFRVKVGHESHGKLPVIQPGELPPETNLSPWQEWKYEGHRWGMAIDLSKCTGCNACTIACQAENNIPVVGKEQVKRSREMHWIRLDRYFKGDRYKPETMQAVQQPMTCQQCETAPCESVCPVAATAHSPEGLNDMVYNRCVGTRYCSNNCPYKVRRFNFFNYHKKLDNDPTLEVTKLMYNPEVTIRHRGVMEKCTYCVQRIQNAKISSRRENREIRDGEVVSACAQACPAEAITFGDLGTARVPTSAVGKLHASGRAYSLLEELNTKPRTRYLAMVRNPNPKLLAKGENEHGHG